MGPKGLSIYKYDAGKTNLPGTAFSLSSVSCFAFLENAPSTETPWGLLQSAVGLGLKATEVSS
jgi:hypothetical protein